jgi:hypothetical protein
MGYIVRKSNIVMQQRKQTVTPREQMKKKIGYI